MQENLRDDGWVEFVRTDEVGSETDVDPTGARDFIPKPRRGGKRCERCERCSCKDFPTGVKILVENVMKGGEKNFKCL